MGGFHKIAVSRVRVNLVKVQGVTFTKFGGYFAKLSSMDYELISPKFEGFSYKIYIPDCCWLLDRPIRRLKNSSLRGHLLEMHQV